MPCAGTHAFVGRVALHITCDPTIENGKILISRGQGAGQGGGVGFVGAILTLALLAHIAGGVASLQEVLQ